LRYRWLCRTYKSAKQLQRLLLFAGASTALHALTLGVYVPSGPGRAGVTAPPAPTLQATLLSTKSDSTFGESSAQAGLDQPSLPPDSSDAVAQQRGTRDAARLPGADKWHPASELDVRAEPLTSVEFNYPPNVSGLVGRVRVALFIDERGFVRKTQVLEAQPEKLFDEAALSGWREVRFSPAMRGGVAVKSQKVVDVDFQPELSVKQ
jgi:TonB family protein